MKYKKLHDGRKISELGIGLYKGKETIEGDKLLYESLIYGLNNGINVIDTAQRYRNGQSEKLVKKIIKKFKNREKLIIISKTGLIPNYVKKKNILKNLKIKKSNFHKLNNFCIDPNYINWSLENSLKLMGTNYIDFYLLHNPEYALLLKDGYKKIINAFKILEKKRDEKKILYYGIATWNGLRRLNNNKYQLNLTKIIYDLEKDLGKNHGFRCLEAPLSIGMPDLLNYNNKNFFNLQNFLKKNKINFFSSASLYEGNLFELSELNKIYNSTLNRSDLPNEIYSASVSFPKSENSLRRLFILLENLKKNNIVFEKILLKIFKNKNIYGIAINLLKVLPFIKSSLIGMEQKKYVIYNLKEFEYKLNVRQKNYLKVFWNKIKKNL